MGWERLIKSVDARSLKWRQNEECAVDRVAAIGFAARYNEAGEVMLRVNALDAHALHRLILLVTRHLFQKLHIGRGYGEKLAIAALHEILRPQCTHCGGRGNHYQRGAVVRVCPHCQGDGIHRYSDQDRARLIGGGYNEKAYEEGLNYMREAIRRIVRSADRRLRNEK